MIIITIIIIIIIIIIYTHKWVRIYTLHIQTLYSVLRVTDLLIG